MNSSTLHAAHVPMGTRLAIGFGYLASYFMAQAMHALAIPYYQMHLGVDPFKLSLILTLPVFIAACVGPLVGHLSDNTVTKLGARKPYLLVFSCLSGMAFGIMWMVPVHWSAHAQLLYLAATASVFFLCTTFYTVPLHSMAYEISDSSAQRTRVIGFSAYFLKLGALTYQWLFPLTQAAIFGGLAQGVKAVGWLLGVGVFALLGSLPGWAIRGRHDILVRHRMKIRHSVKCVVQNPAMRCLCLFTLCQMGGNACVALFDYNLLVYYVYDGDLEQGAYWKALLSTAFAVGSILYVPVITRLSVRLGKLRVLQFVLLMNCVGGVAKWFLFVPGSGVLILLDAVFCSAIWTAMVISVPALVADLSQEDRAKSHTTHTGVFASVHSWVVSLGSVLALLVYGGLLNAIGFDASVNGQQSEATFLSMRVFLSAGTLFFSLLGLILLSYWRAQQFTRDDIGHGNH